MIKKKKSKQGLDPLKTTNSMLYNYGTWNECKMQIKTKQNDYK